MQATRPRSGLEHALRYATLQAGKGQRWNPSLSALGPSAPTIQKERAARRPPLRIQKIPRRSTHAEALAAAALALDVGISELVRSFSASLNPREKSR